MCCNHMTAGVKSSHKSRYAYIDLQCVCVYIHTYKRTDTHTHTEGAENFHARTSSGDWMDHHTGSY